MFLRTDFSYYRTQKLTH